MDKSKRLLSIDALRGFDMLFIMGFAAFLTDLCGLFPGGADCALARNMSHASWNGLLHHDTIFPLFLFISGMTFPFSCSRQVEKGSSRRKIVLNIIRRGLVLVLLGLVYNGFFNLKLATLRLPSVLGRIGLAWMGAALLYVFVPKWSWRAVISAVILVGYNLLLLIPAPDVAGADPLSLEGNIVGYVDRVIMPNHLLTRGVFDPEGLLSTLPAIVTAMLGVFTGEFVRSGSLRGGKSLSGGRKAASLAVAGVVLLGAGLLWSLVLPINKKLWTSSFVLVLGAYSVLLFALFYWIIDVKGWKKWTPFFQVIGLNSITIYLAQRIISFGGINNYFFAGFAGLFPANVGAVILDATYILICWLFLYFLYKKEVFLKV